ncbi:MAG TPA: hypothetical protein VF710_13755 [Longimicrobium sp.]|jgi:hypothetical protein
MTAEIALLNKESVALAADSAVTIRTPGGTKILPSANKIFALSKHHPVGVMVYGNAQLLGAPWELLVKTYRKQLGRKEFPRLEDYADDFLRYLERARNFFPESVQQAHFREVASNVFSTIRKNIRTDIAVFVTEHDTATEQDILDIAERRINVAYERSLDLVLQPTLTQEFLDNVKVKWKDDILEGIETIFEKYVQSDAVREKLVDLAIAWLCKAVPDHNEGDSGLVVAGYGTDDVYPALRAFKIEGIVDDHLIYLQHVTWDVEAQGASIIPFAQIDVVHTFMEGVDEKYLEVIEQAVAHALKGFAEVAATESGKRGESLREFREMLKGLAERAAEHFVKLGEAYRSEKFAHPTVEVVAILPKDRLAAMAESLVDITALRRQFSMTEETVGGPIDVAVISKGDGFVWIRRKHYFDKTLNPQFFHNYFEEG